MSIPALRFRPRQGERRVEHSSIQHWQSIVDAWKSRIEKLVPRYATHLAVVMAAITVLSISLPDLSLGYQPPPRATPTAVPVLGSRALRGAVVSRGGSRGYLAQVAITQTETISRPLPVQLASLTTADLLGAPVVHTTIPVRLRRDVITYVVEKGDNRLKIAAQFDLEQDTVMWANSSLERNPDLLRPGQELVILPIDGVYHTVAKGETIEKIAKKYQADIQDVIACVYNGLDPENPQIAVGQKLIVPGGVKPYTPIQVSAYKGPIPESAEHGTGVFAWPTSGYLTDRFAFRTQNGRWHGGLDISGYKGAPIYAADSGFVIQAGWTTTGYGNLVIIDHRNGFVTYYAHLAEFYVSAGQSVTKGTLIALMGSTGSSTGPHLHFEVREKDVRKNPEAYLP